MPELTEEELKELSGARALLDKMTRDPRTKRETERLIKLHHPEVITTEDVEKPLHDKIAELQKQIDDDRETRRSREIDDRLGTEYKALRDDGWTDEGIEKLKKFQVERKIASPLDAAGAWDRAFPKPKEQPSPLAPSSWNFGQETKDEDIKSLFENEDAWAEQEARKAWADAVKERIET